MVLNNKSDSYTFDLVRNLDEKSVESSCISLQGQYNVATGACSVKITAPTVCNTVPNAYRGPATTANSQPCESTVIAPRACTGGQVIKGFDPQGNPQCASI